ncbi:MAG: vitamin B12 dependent-methionine synthase activation domain-containing protein [Bacteroidota bacterium]
MSEKKVTYDPLIELIAYYQDKKTIASKKKSRTGTIEEILKQRIIDGDKIKLDDDLKEALKKFSPLEIINTHLLDGMKVVGELFGSGQMQLPFVLQSAEVMKSAVKFLEPFMDRSDSTSKGVLVLATVKGDVHDIGKNLVEIILSNNGYKVVNLGIKCAIETMLQSFEEHKADAIGMSGLLVKSTVVMKENLEVINNRNLKIPIILGGAALTRRYVEDDLRSIYNGTVVYATDAFAGLHFMEKLKTEGVESFKKEKIKKLPIEDVENLTGAEAKIALSMENEIHHSNILPAENIPTPPFWGSKVVEDISIDEVYRYINHAALIKGQWQVRKGKMSEEDYQKELKEIIYPELEKLQIKSKFQKLLQPKVVYGYFPCQSDGDDLIIYREDKKTEQLRFTFPRQKSDRYLCLSDYFASIKSGKIDVVAFHLVTMGKRASEFAQQLYSNNNYKDYLFFHGLSVESAEALAELWHKKIREELGFANKDAKEIKRLFSQGYQGARYSFGYPACPNLEDSTKLFELLEPERIGVNLTEEFMMEPEQSTDAIIIHHPQARYFNI